LGFAAAQGNTHREVVRKQMVKEAAAKKPGAAKYRPRDGS
jgi:hypothetical protein